MISNSNKLLRLKKIARAVLPPIVTENLSMGLTRLGWKKAEWELLAEGWPPVEVIPTLRGWNVATVAEVYRANWNNLRKSQHETTPFGLNESQFNLIQHNTLMTYGYVLARAAHNKTQLSLLDWGGAIGQYFLLSKALLPELELDYHCKDMPLLVAYGRQLLPHAHFYTDEGCLNRSYDLVLASSSLQYSQDWIGTLNGLAQATNAYLFVTRLPVVQQSASFVTVQRPYDKGYKTEYAGWCLNRQEFLQASQQAGLELVREFIMGDRLMIKHAPEIAEGRGFLFRPVLKEQSEK